MKTVELALLAPINHNSQLRNIRYQHKVLLGAFSAPSVGQSGTARGSQV